MGNWRSLAVGLSTVLPKMADQFFTNLKMHLRRNHQRVKPRHRMPTLAMLSRGWFRKLLGGAPDEAPKSAISLCAFVYAEGSAALFKAASMRSGMRGDGGGGLLT